MTVEEIKNSTEVFLKPADIAPLLHCDPNWIRRTAHESPADLGFPVTVINTRTRIPRKPFLDYIGENSQ